MSFLKPSTKEAGEFLSALNEASQELKKSNSKALDSAEDFRDELRRSAKEINVPETLQVALDEAGKDSGKILEAFTKGANAFEKMHGFAPSADYVEHAIHMAYSQTAAANHKFGLRNTFDSADNTHHDSLSLQPNRAVVSVLSIFGDACPFAHYMPADIGSNEAKLAILTHRAAHTNGLYRQGDSLDGINSGERYMSTSRVHTSNPAAGTGAITGKITHIQATVDTCDPAAGDVVLLRGRSKVYVNGVPVAREASSVGEGNSPIVGSVRIGSVNHIIGGSINTETGSYALTSTPALPDTVSVAVEAFIDIERDETRIPSVNVHAETFQLFANVWQASTRATISSRTQMANELSLDALSQGMLAINSHFANERHYEALAKGMRIARSFAHTFDVQRASAINDGGQAGVYRDLLATIEQASIEMAARNFSGGITHLYVGSHLASKFAMLGADIFRPSGLPKQPGIYRLGTLANQYEVYYTPKVVASSATASTILAVGRSSDVARNPILFGDAVAPLVRPLATTDSLREGAAFYGRSFTEVNPHGPSAQGFAAIEVINM